MAEPPFTVGIEEEYLLVDPETGALAANPPEELFEECSVCLPNLTAHEFLRSQIEVNTKVCTTIPEAQAQLSELRATVADVARQFDLGLIAASTHPFSHWEAQQHTDGERYNIIAKDIQTPVRRMMIGGMHVHVGLGADRDVHIDLMNQVSYFLPHLLAFSTSSPFWKGENTGLKSYRLSVFNEMPRTGLPDRFDSHSEYQRHVDVLVKAGLIEDATKLWWDLRPSARFPTLEMRICDVCTRVEDAGAIAALYQSILRMLFRLKQNNQRWRAYAPMLINENRWRAQRYGLDAGLVDFGRGAVISCNELLDELFDLVAEDGDALGCGAALGHLRSIQDDGTSAHRQIAVYEKSLDEGLDKEAALRAIVSHLQAETLGRSEG